jgi:hypothetical protein
VIVARQEPLGGRGRVISACRYLPPDAHEIAPDAICLIVLIIGVESSAVL